MNNNPVLNYILWGVKILIIGIGSYLCLNSMIQGNPKSYDPNNMSDVELLETPKQADGSVLKSDYDRVQEENAKRNEDAYNNQVKKIHSVASQGTKFALWLTVGVAIVALLLGVYSLIVNIHKAKPLLIGLVAFVVVVLIAFFMASNEPIANWQQIKGGSLSLESAIKYSKWASVGFTALTVLLIGAVTAVIVGEVSKLFK